jgi:regulator of sirC expression with transglutaminase-like and TPR domain
MLSQRESILRLLSDEDTETAELVEDQLVARGAEVLPELRELVASASGRVERRLRETMGEIERRIASQKLAEICARFHDESDIEEAAWAVAAVLRPGEDFSESRNLLDAWGAELAKRLRETETVEEQHEVISDLLGAQMHLRGNEDDYYSLENSILPSVVESRLGIPISLALVYILVGKRAGLRVEGVSLPGHFIARIGSVFFDPFHGGRRMQLNECRKLLESQGVELHPNHLLPCSPKVILLRTLNNILHVAGQDLDDSLATLAKGLIELLKQGKL